MNIQFSIDNQKITQINPRFIASDSVKYLVAEFIFSDDWDGFLKTAVFKGVDGVFSVILEEDCCTVPYEALTGAFEVSVFGVSDGVRITTDSVYVPVQRSGYAEGEAPQEPSPTVYEQIIGELTDLRENGTDIGDGTVTLAKLADEVMESVENKSNKITQINEYSTNEQYASAKAVFEAISGVKAETLTIEYTDIDNPPFGNKVYISADKSDMVFSFEYTDSSFMNYAYQIKFNHNGIWVKSHSYRNSNAGNPEEAVEWENIENAQIKYITGSSNNPIVLFELNRGTYFLSGYFVPYEGSTDTIHISEPSLAIVGRNSATALGPPRESQIQIVGDKHIDFIKIEYASFTGEYSSNIETVYLENTLNRVKILDSTVTHNQYPSAKAVYDYVESIAPDIPEDLTLLPEKIGDLNDLQTTEKASVVSAINELNNRTEAVEDTTDTLISNTAIISGAIGDLNSLQTTDQSSVVAAINEVHSEMGDIDTALDGIIAIQNQLTGGGSV